MSTYYTVEISAETEDQAKTLLDKLLEQKLVTGGQFIKMPARFLWEGEVVDMDYVTTTSFTTDSHKQAVIAAVEANSKETVPMVRFTPFEGNQKLLTWIDQTLEP